MTTTKTQPGLGRIVLRRAIAPPNQGPVGIEPLSAAAVVERPEGMHYVMPGGIRIDCPRAAHRLPRLGRRAQVRHLGAYVATIQIDLRPIRIVHSRQTTVSIVRLEPEGDTIGGLRHIQRGRDVAIGAQAQRPPIPAVVLDWRTRSGGAEAVVRRQAPGAIGVRGGRDRVLEGQPEHGVPGQRRPVDDHGARHLREAVDAAGRRTLHSYLTRERLLLLWLEDEGLGRKACVGHRAGERTVQEPLCVPIGQLVSHRRLVEERVSGLDKAVRGGVDPASSDLLHL